MFKRSTRSLNFFILIARDFKIKFLHLIAKTFNLSLLGQIFP